MNLATTLKIEKDLNSSSSFTWEGANLIPSLFIFLFGVTLYNLPIPQGLTPQSWHLFAIFISTILGIITRPLPICPTVLIGVLVALLTHSMTFEQTFSCYTHGGIWLIFFAFFLARAFIKTNLANRISYKLISLLGKNIMGLCYGIMLSELIISPFIPSLVARGGGIIYPILLALAKHHNDGLEEKQLDQTAAYIILTVFHGSLICSAMFLTSMAANPLAAAQAGDLGINLNWGTWALASSAPGLVSFLITPWIMLKLVPPKIQKSKDGTNATDIAKEKLKELGAITGKEWIMMGIFFSILSLWVFGKNFGINNATAGLLGLTLLIFCGILSWKECLKESVAWETLLWMGFLLSFGNQLKALGFFSWFASFITSFTGECHWIIGFSVISLIYFYSHYFFASNIAHLSAMFFALLTAAIEMGTPPIVAACALSFLSSLFGGLTHYGCGPAPLFFSCGYISLKKWWQVGFVVGTINFIIWIFGGMLWWKVIGLW